MDEPKILGATPFLDVELPTLPGSNLPPIYDTCTQIRTKINKLINNKASNCKHLSFSLLHYLHQP